MPTPDEIVKAALANAKKPEIAVAPAVEVPVKEAIRKNAEMKKEVVEVKDRPRFIAGNLTPVNESKLVSDKPVKPGLL